MSTSIVRVTANRRNAARSTGPRTAAGKAAVSQNAVRHGLLSERPVSPGVERAEDWDAHVAGTLGALAPAGYLEAMLAGRVALTLRRLARVARYERDATALAQAACGDGSAEATEARQYAAILAMVRAFPAGPDGDPVGTNDVLWVVQTAGRVAEVDVYDDATLREPAWYPPGAAFEDLERTAGRVREYVACVARHAGQDPAAVWEAVAAHVAHLAEDKAAEAEKAVARADRRRRDHLLLGAKDLDRVTRYEAALERGLYKAPHELQRLQAARAGQPVPPPAAST